MSKESVQFIEMVRQAAARKREIEYYRLFCDQCGKETAHQVIEIGQREIYICILCGRTQEYYVR